MSVEQNKATLRRMYEEVWNRGNMSVIPELIALNYHFGERKGPEGWRQIVTTMRTAFPDVHYTIDQIVGEGEWLAYRVSVRGTFKGRYGNIEPTGKQFNSTQAFFSLFKDGKLMTAIGFGDTLSFYQQLGVKPPAQ